VAHKLVILCVQHAIADALGWDTASSTIPHHPYRYAAAWWRSICWYPRCLSTTVASKWITRRQRVLLASLRANFNCRYC